MVLRKIENKSFIRSSEGALPTYSWTDVASGAGYINVYGYSAYNSAGALVYRLGTENVYSEEKEKAATGGVGTVTLELNFDFVSNYTRVINGDLIVNFPACGIVQSSSSSAQTCTYHFEATLMRVRGGTETSLGTGKTAEQTITQSAGGAWAYSASNRTIIASISDAKILPGDIVRLELKGISSVTGQVGGTAIGYDPKGRFGGTYITAANGAELNTLILNIPFKIDL